MTDLPPLRATCVEWPDGLVPGSGEWRRCTDAVLAETTDIIVTNELPFRPWLAAQATVDAGAAQASINRHAAGITALAALGLPAVISSQPVWEGARLANEAVVIADGIVTAVHRKRYFPEDLKNVSRPVDRRRSRRL